MMSPLAKRIPRELLGNLGKYLGIFVMMLVAISFVTGFLAAAKSLESIILGMRSTYTIEDARFTVTNKLKPAVLDRLRGTDEDDEDKLTCRVLEDFYYNASASTSANSSVTLHLWTVPQREKVNKPAYAQGTAPQAANEVALDRVFCANNKLSVGDTLQIQGRSFMLTGILTLPDAQALFEDNSAFTFNAITYGVGLVGADGAAALEDGGLAPSYLYSVLFDDSSLSQNDRVSQEYRLRRILNDEDIYFMDFLDQSANQGIGYALDDIQGDQGIWTVLMVLLIVIMAFVFVVLNNAYIEEESAAIGTLLSMGYRNAELVRHYMALPVLVGLAAALLGNVLGYTVLTEPMVGLYCNSYSLPPYVASFHPDVFVFATLLPLALLWGVSYWGIRRAMGHTPLQFLRHELSCKAARRQLQLPLRWSFMRRFRLRVILRGLPTFITLFFGIAFASLLLLFGVGLLPVVSNYAVSMQNDLVAEHTYTLSEPLELEGSAEKRQAYAAQHELDVTEASAMTAEHRRELKQDAKIIKKLDNAVNTQVNSAQAVAQAEKFAVASFKVKRAMGSGEEDVKVYGIQENSAYWTDLHLSGSDVLVGRGLAEKCSAATGKMLSLSNEYSGWSYSVKPTGLTGSAACMDVYMSIGHFNELFGNHDDYFNGYYSNQELQLDSWVLVADLTPASMGAIAAQMESSMGKVTGMFYGLAMAIYLVLMYLLTKNAIDGAARSISYMKVFGYKNREINSLYLTPISATVIASLLLSLPLVYGLLALVVKLAFMSYSGNLELVLPASSYMQVIAAGIVTYAAVALLHVRRIKRVPMSIALKSVE